MARTRTVTITKSISLDVEVTAEVRFGRPRPASLTPDSSWVPGDEASEVEIVSIASPLGAALNIVDELDKDERQEIESAAVSAAADNEVADREAAEESAADAAREDRLLGGERPWGED